MARIKVLYNFKTVSVLTFLKIVFLIVPINCKNFANVLNIKKVEYCAELGCTIYVNGTTYITGVFVLAMQSP